MFKLPELQYQYNALEPYIDAQTMEIHHSKHHAAYVTNLNEALKDYPNFSGMEINALMKNLDKVSEDIRTKVKNNAGGHANHSLFWTLMGSKMGGEPKGKLNEAIRGSFGSFDKFKEQFALSAIGHFGSGWAWLTVAENKLLIEDTGNQDSPLSQGRIPILTLDVWEHAYYLKYQNRRIEYIEAFWSIINWPEVEKNYLEALAK